jgi:hypothetical protein
VASDPLGSPTLPRSLELTWVGKFNQRPAHFSASVHDPLLFHDLKRLDLAKREDLHDLFNRILPKKITNSCGTDEDPLAYIIRHTQLLPRQILAIFNAALSDHYKSSGTFRGITEKSIRNGITAVEKRVEEERARVESQQNAVSQKTPPTTPLDELANSLAVKRLELQKARLPHQRLVVAAFVVCSAMLGEFPHGFGDLFMCFVFAVCASH